MKGSILRAYISENIEKAQRENIPSAVSKFLDSASLSAAAALARSTAGRFIFWGGFEGAERVVMLSVPFGLAGSFIFVWLMGGMSMIPGTVGQVAGMIFGTPSNNIYTQIALIMLIGLLAKNAILIVEFALDRRKMGMSITWAAVLGAGARLRPILMTSMAMIIGLLPMMFAFGVGANGNRALGTTAIGGMLIGMILQIYIVPVLFVIFQSLQEKLTPMHWDDVENSGEAVSDIEQYSK